LVDAANLTWVNFAVAKMKNASSLSGIPDLKIPKIQQIANENLII